VLLHDLLEGRGRSMGVYGIPLAELPYVGLALGGLDVLGVLPPYGSDLERDLQRDRDLVSDPAWHRPGRVFPGATYTLFS